MLRTVTADRGDAGKRLDLMLRRRLADVDEATRTRVQMWIENGRVSVNGAPVRRAAARVAVGDAVSIVLPPLEPRGRMPAEELGLEVLYEDDHLLAIDKPAGMVVHPTYKHATGTLMNGLLWRGRGWPTEQRPSIVGRLDRLTSGIVVVAKSAALHAALQRAMASKDCAKEYLAIVYGRVKTARGRIDLRLRVDRDGRKVVASTTVGSASLTRFERLASVAAPRAGLSLLRCRLVTGRRHQIRVHLAACGWPIVGDATYGEPRWQDIADPALAERLRSFPRQALHAWRLRLPQPHRKEFLEIEAPLPNDMQELIEQCRLS